MKNKIGIFDSGVGGLTVLKSLSDKYKCIDYIYIGDNKYCPYGDKTKEELLNYAKRIVNYFIEKGITRSYILHNGKEITTWFSMEGDATCGSWDLYRHKAGFEYVETLEETLTYSISIDKLNDLYKSRIDIANWMRVLQQENFLLL